MPRPPRSPDVLPRLRVDTAWAVDLGHHLKAHTVPGYNRRYLKPSANLAVVMADVDRERTETFAARGWAAPIPEWGAALERMTEAFVLLAVAEGSPYCQGDEHPEYRNGAAPAQWQPAKGGR
jgi:hypothetical protein